LMRDLARQLAVKLGLGLLLIDEMTELIVRRNSQVGELAKKVQILRKSRRRAQVQRKYKLLNEY